MALTLASNDRVLLLGASGWFGLTFQHLVPKGVPLLLVASRRRGPYVTWDFSTVRDFSPTIVVNFAFLTSEHVETEGVEKFIRVNESLTKQLLHAAELPSVRAIMTASSGAAMSASLSMDTNPYGVLKLCEERSLMSLASHWRNVVVARAWSVSGPYVRNPHRYAFSDFVIQAWLGEVDIRATRPVVRRYVSASDFLHVCAEHLSQGWTGDIDSGGERIEMGKLASRIISAVNPSATVNRPELTSHVPSEYASDNSSWEAALSRIGFEAANIEEQVRMAAPGLITDYRRRL